MTIDAYSIAVFVLCGIMLAVGIPLAIFHGRKKK